MIGRAIGIALISSFVFVTVTGIALVIALDFVGEEIISKFVRERWVTRAEVVSATGLENARDITFFTEAQVMGSPVTVNTGIRFATIDDLVAKKEAARWCYVVLQAGGSLPRQLTLASQDGAGRPTYKDLSVYPESEFVLLGVDALALATIARTHCRFSGGQSADAGGDLSNERSPT